MQVKVMEVPNSVSMVQPNEVWIQVLANRVVSWGEVSEIFPRLTPDLAERYGPLVKELSDTIHEDADDYGYSHEHWFILGEKVA